MIELIKKKVFEYYKNNETKGIFFTIMDQKDTILFANGVIETDKTLDQTIDTIYHGMMDKIVGGKYVIVDVVTYINKETDLKKLISLPAKEYGFCFVHLEDNKTGVVLPNTKGIDDVKHAMEYIKQKNGISGNGEIYVFKTNRITIKI